MKALYNGKLILEDKIVEGKAVIFNESIQAIVDEEYITDEVIEKIDAGGCFISPGFIDIHIHGSGGCDAMDGNIEALNTISKTIIKNGTTGFLPTTMTMDMVSIHKALDVIRKAMNMRMQGAQVLGAHMEGPFINKKYKGAQNEIYVIPPNIKYIENYLDVIKIITMAPEVEDGINFIEDIQKYKEIVLSIGHTNATYEEAMAAIKQGIRHATHIFNAMTPLHHRDPGTVGAVFNSKITCELIADKIHIHPQLFQMLINIKGEDKIVLITDSMRAGCMKEGQYDLGGQNVVVKDGSARLENGSLAGSVLTLNKAVHHFVQETKMPLHEIVKMASLNPARVIGLDNKKGSIVEGKDADLIVYDQNIEVKMSFVNGNLEYIN